MHDSVAQAKHLQCSLVLESTPQMCDVDESGIYSIDVLPDGILPESSVLSGPDFRKRGISIAEQLPEESLMALLPDRRAAANPDHVLTHRIEEARRAANRKRDDRQKPAGESRPAPPPQGNRMFKWPEMLRECL